MVFNTTVNNILELYIVAVSFIGGINRSTRIKHGDRETTFFSAKYTDYYCHL